MGGWWTRIRAALAGGAGNAAAGQPGYLTPGAAAVESLAVSMFWAGEAGRTSRPKVIAFAEREPDGQMGYRVVAEYADETVWDGDERLSTDRIVSLLAALADSWPTLRRGPAAPDGFGSGALTVRFASGEACRCALDLRSDAPRVWVWPQRSDPGRGMLTFQPDDARSVVDPGLHAAVLAVLNPWDAALWSRFAAFV